MATLSKYASVKLKATVSTTADPTGTAPSFAVLDPDTDTDPTDDGAGGDNWVTGEWGTWDATALQVDAITPTMPSAASSIDASTVDTYQVWIKFTVSGETFIEQFDTLVVT